MPAAQPLCAGSSKSSWPACGVANRAVALLLERDAHRGDVLRRAAAAGADVFDAQGLHLLGVGGHHLWRTIVGDLLLRPLRQPGVRLSDKVNVVRLAGSHLSDDLSLIHI